MENKRPLLFIGEYPPNKNYSHNASVYIGLSEARQIRDEAKAKVGIDSSLQKQIKKTTLLENNLQAIAKQWLSEQKAGWSKSHYSRVCSYLENDAYPLLGSREVSAIEAP